MAASSDIRLNQGRVSPLRRALAVLLLLRPVNLLMFCAGVFLGGVLTGHGAVLRGAYFAELLAAALAVAAIGGAANSLNDVLDLRIDRINRPERPLASGLLSRRTGILVWLIGSAVGMALSALLSNAHLLISGVAVGALVVYSVWFKRVILVGNVLVAALVAVSLLFGALVVDDLRHVLFAATFAFLLTFVREVVKDAADLDGDAAFDAHTVASTYGRLAATRLAFAVSAATIALTPLPFLLAGYSTLYLSIVLGADLLMLWAMWAAARLDGTSLDRSSNLLKWAMLVGMVALAAAHAME